MGPQAAVLNPQAPPFFPSHNPQPISTEHFLPGYVVSSPPPPDCFYFYHPAITPPPPPSPFLPYHEAEPSYVLDVAKEYDHHLHAETTDENHKKQEVDSKRVSKQRFLSAIISGCGRRKMEVRRTKGFRPPPLASRPNGRTGCDQQIQDRILDNSRVFPRNKKIKHPVVPVRPDGNTTIMIRNIPNKYTRAMLIEFLDNHCLAENQKQENEQDGGEHMVSAFDLVYLPIDFSSRLNKGYAFVNFTNPKGAWKFHVATNNKKWDFFQSQKICDNVAARLQGKEKLLSHLDSMNFPCDWDEVLPVCFSPPRDGTVKGSQRTLGKQISLNNNDSGGGGSGKQWKETTRWQRICS